MLLEYILSTMYLSTILLHERCRRCVPREKKRKSEVNLELDLCLLNTHLLRSQMKPAYASGQSGEDQGINMILLTKRMTLMLHVVCRPLYLLSYGNPQDGVFHHGHCRFEMGHEVMVPMYAQEQVHTLRSSSLRKVYFKKLTMFVLKVPEGMQCPLISDPKPSDSTHSGFAGYLDRGLRLRPMGTLRTNVCCSSFVLSLLCLSW